MATAPAAMRPRPPVNVVPKTWGREVWIVNNQTYCGKILYITAGKTGSLHFHQHKTETFYLRVGRLYITTGAGFYATSVPQTFGTTGTRAFAVDATRPASASRVFSPPDSVPASWSSCAPLNMNAPSRPRSSCSPDSGAACRMFCQTVVSLSRVSCSCAN